MTGTPGHIPKPHTDMVVEEEKARIRQRRHPVADERPSSEYPPPSNTERSAEPTAGLLRRLWRRLRA